MGVIGKTVDEYVMKPFPNNAHEFAYIGVMVANSSCVIMLLDDKQLHLPTLLWTYFP